MLELVSVSHIFTRPGQEALKALDHVSFHVPAGHLLAVIGAAGSGKTTLLQLLAGIRPASGGSILLHGQEMNPATLNPNSTGFVPASDECLLPLLTVQENLMSALFLRVAGLTAEQRSERTRHILAGVGLENQAAQRVSTLGITQRRRLKLALALVSEPSVVICDEFTDGLDARAQSEMAALLKFITGDHPSRVVVHATQTAANLALHDTVVILQEGQVCFHGPSKAVAHYFSIQALEELYPRLAKRPAARWAESWSRHRESYYQAFKLGETLKAPGDDDREEEAAEPPRDPGHITLPANEKPQEEKAAPPASPPPPAAPALPSLWEQARHLAHRRWTLLARNQRDWTSQLLLTFLAPLAAAMLMLPNDHYLSEVTAGETAPASLWPAAYTCAMGWLVEILIVMAFAVRTASRELAGDRPVYRRERAGGLRPAAALLGKLGYVLPLVLLQTFVLGLTVEVLTGGLPGFALARLALLGLTGTAFASLCLAVSAYSRTPERAMSQAWTLTFANLFLSGALLGFPRVLGGLLQPVVTAYYGWSGGMETLAGTPFYEPLTLYVRTWFASPWMAMLALAAHFTAGLLLALRGLNRIR